MPTVTVTEKGHIIIPVNIRARYGLTPGAQVEIIDEGRTIRLLVQRQVTPSRAEAGYCMVKIKPRLPGSSQRLLSEFDPAAALKQRTSKA